MTPHLFHLLEAVKRKDDLALLHSRGLETHQVFALLQMALAQKLVSIDGRTASLTDDGEAVLANARMRRRASGSSAWIREISDASFEPMDPFAVYLPKRGWRAR